MHAQKDSPAIFASDPETNWFRGARFGMFIHWGLYSVQGLGEWHMDRVKMPTDQYNKLTDQFHPDSLDVREWARLARRAGATYVVLTTRHHDGYSLFDTKCSDFNSVRTTGRDFVREYVDALRVEGLKVGLYYSIMSWQFPAIHSGPMSDPRGWAAMVEQTHEQVRELMTNYGKIDLLWYDGCVVPGMSEGSVLARYWGSRKLNAMARSLQPGLLINDRSGLPEDFDTPEQHVTAPKGRRMWELCMTMNNSWGFVERDHAFKTERELLTYLIYCARNGGNILLNIGPRGDGAVPETSVRRLETIGDWLSRNGEAIYGSERRSITERDHPALFATTRGNRAYAHVFDMRSVPLRLSGIRGRVDGACVLGNGTSLSARTLPGGVVEIDGLDRVTVDPAGLPTVIAVDLAKGASFGRVGGLLLGVNAIENDTPSDVPILGCDTGHGAPPAGDLIDASQLAADGSGQLRLSESSDWCPSWTAQHVASNGGNLIIANADTPVVGVYDVEIGLVSDKAGEVAINISGRTGETTYFLPTGYPTTIRITSVPLNAGRHALRVHGTDGARLGIYALRISPVWTPIPSECWETAGPFPCLFAVGQSDETVRTGLATENLLEENGVADAALVDGGIASWSSVNRRRGDFSALGVNYATRQVSTGPGVCYARTTIVSDVAQEIAICVGCDWWANVFVNGHMVASARPAERVAADGAMFNGHKPMLATCRLESGPNTVVVKSHPGRAAHWFTFFVNDPVGLVVRASSLAPADYKAGDSVSSISASVGSGSLEPAVFSR